jgi:DNA repair exonuclease SbcCD ATPase subunit
MLKEKLWTSKISQVDNILHIADVHIRNFKRHDEYKSVFEKLYKLCREKVQEVPNTVIYLAGDIVHAKTDMTPELIDIVTEFLDTLSKIAPTILIAGNHDCNLNNPSRMDALSPIVNLIDSDLNTLFYLKETGVYTLHNVDFILNSVYESPDNFILAKDVVTDNTKIVLFHGAVDMASTDMGTFMKNKSITIEKFEGFDYGMFGDIHKFQYLNPNGTIAYAGSLIQQNFGEGLVHGIIEWDIKNKKSKFIQIENDWTYHTIDVDDGKIQNLPTYFSQNNVIRLRSANTSNADIFKIITKLKSTVNVVDIRVQRLNNKIASQSTTQNKITGDIRDVEHQNKLIAEYINSKYTVTDDIIDKVYNINRSVNSKILSSDIVRNTVWIPIKFEFDNMFSYGEGNVINFNRMNGSYGLFAPNATGKSSILDALMFCLFDKCSRTFKASQILNNKKDEFRCKLQFTISDKDYFIERKGTKDKKGNVKVVVDFWYEEDGEKHSLNGEDRDSTNFIIRKYIGTYDDFIITAMSVQGNNTNFIDKAQRDRKDLLAQFLDLELFEELNSIATDEIKSVQTLIKEFSKQDYSTKIAESNVKFKEYSTLLDETIDKKNYLTRKIEEINNELIDLNKKIIVIDDDFSQSSIQSLSEKKYLLERKLQEINSSEISLEDELKSANESYNKYNRIVLSFDKDDLMKKKDWLDGIRNQLNIHEADLRSIKLNVQHCQDKIDHLKDHEYDPNCKFCINNVFVKDAERAKSQIWGFQQDRDELIYEIKDLQEKISKNSNVYVESERLYKAENDLFYYQKEIYGIEKRIYTNKDAKKDVEEHLLNVETAISKMKENEEAIKQNLEIQSIIDTKEKEKRYLNSEIKENEENIIEYSGQVKIYEQVIKDCAESIKKLQELEKEFSAYDYYLKAVNRNGVPYELISDALPRIQSETNNILSQIVEFQVLFETDGKSINTYIVYDDDNYWPLEMTSGMEKFISSLAIRSALIQVSSLPRPNFLAIDEGLGVLDPTVLTNFSLFLDYLKTQFDFVILISHIDIVRDIVDSQIEIKKEKGFSKIER